MFEPEELVKFLNEHPDFCRSFRRLYCERHGEDERSVIHCLAEAKKYYIFSQTVQIIAHAELRTPIEVCEMFSKPNKSG